LTQAAEPTFHDAAITSPTPLCRTVLKPVLFAAFSFILALGATAQTAGDATAAGRVTKAVMRGALEGANTTK
jgi:hypothetical protein